MQPQSQAFKRSAQVALLDPNLQRALERAKTGFVDNRAKAVSDFGTEEFERQRTLGREIKEHTLAHLDYYLECYEQKVQERGGHVHWAASPEDACATIVQICQQAGARLVTKGKSMVGEEIGLNDALLDAGLEPAETDLGEYILQLANEAPSHIVAPAIHKTKDEIADLFFEHHRARGLDKRQTEVPAMVDEARQVLREKFLAAEAGITGANFLVAETGSSVIVTNEGNGDLTNTLPRVHIVIAGIEKVIPTLEDMSTVLRLLARSATGQTASVYTTVTTGPRRSVDLDGPSEYHVVLLDNGRTQMLGNEFHHMLRCIRCGACMNHCPVYQSVGGQSYGWVYVGPMGSVLTPLMVGLEQAGHLPNACTLNGRCLEVCPMQIPLPDMLRSLRARQHEEKLSPPRARTAVSAWALLARHPLLYRFVFNTAARLLGLLARIPLGVTGRFRWLPFASGWTNTRDFPAPRGRTFMSAWQEARRRRASGAGRQQ